MSSGPRPQWLRNLQPVTLSVMKLMDLVRRHRIVFLLPLLVVVVFIAFAAYVLSRPVIGTGIYQP